MNLDDVLDELESKIGSNLYRLIAINEKSGAKHHPCNWVNRVNVYHH